MDISIIQPWGQMGKLLILAKSMAHDVHRRMLSITSIRPSEGGLTCNKI